MFIAQPPSQDENNLAAYEYGAAYQDDPLIQKCPILLAIYSWRISLVRQRVRQRRPPVCDAGLVLLKEYYQMSRLALDCKMGTRDRE